VKTYDAVLAALWNTDLMGLADLGGPADEYSPEAKDIVSRINEVVSYRDAERVLKEVFAQNFGEQADGLRFDEAGRKFYKEMAEKGIIKPPVRGLA